MALIRIMIADDHPGVHEWVAKSLEQHPKTTLVAQAFDGNTILPQIEAQRPDVLILDYQMPLDGALPYSRDTNRNIPQLTISKCKRTFPEMRIIMHTSIAHWSTIKRLLMRGADAYVVKGDKISFDIAAIVPLVVAGEQVVSDRAREALAEHDIALPIEPK